MNAHYPALRHRKQRKRVSFAQIIGGGQRKPAEILYRPDVTRRHTGLLQARR